MPVEALLLPLRMPLFCSFEIIALVGCGILGHPVRRQVRLVKLLPVDTVMDIWCKQQGIE